MAREVDHIWYSDQYYDIVGKTTTTGDRIGGFDPQDSDVKDLAWDGTHVWAINTSGDIKKYSVNGVLEKALTGLLDNGWGLTYDGYYLWASDPVQDRIYRIALDAPLDIETASLPAASLGVSYTETLNASGGYPPYTWKLFSGDLPDGLELDSSGVISGVPTKVQTSEFAVAVYDSLLAWKTNDFSIMVGETHTEHNGERGMPHEFGLIQNYPNPFNIYTTIWYTLPDERYETKDEGQYRPGWEGVPSQSFVSLRIFDILGEEVRILVNEPKRLGEYYSVSWDGLDNFGREMPTGIYFCRLKAGGFTATKKMMALK